VRALVEPNLAATDCPEILRGLPLEEEHPPPGKALLDQQRSHACESIRCKCAKELGLFEIDLVRRRHPILRNMMRIIPKLRLAGTSSTGGAAVSGDAREKPAHRRIAAEHRTLDALFGEVRAILRVLEARGKGRLALLHALDEVKSHLFREESLYYPTIWTLRPDYMGPLRLLVDSHAHFRNLIGAITECVEKAKHEDAARRFEEFTALFEEHEGAEEELLETLEQDLGIAQ
jgi:hypothetical protein